MQHFSGNILDGNQILVESVKGILFVNAPPDRMKSWHGTFNLPTGEHIEVGGPYHLELDDGRSGEIFIKHMYSNSTGTNMAEFQGSGPLE